MTTKPPPCVGGGRGVGARIVEVLTDGNADDARTVLGLIDEMDDVASFTADTGVGA